MIEEDAKQHGRWVQHVKAIRVLSAADAADAAAPAAKAAAAPRPCAVWLVGMGPGDPELVTFKAAKVLKEADCVFCFDYLKDEVARFVPREKITVASPLLMGRFRGQSVQELPPQARERAEQSRQETARFLPRVRSLVAGGKEGRFRRLGRPALYCPWSWVTEEFADLQPSWFPA